MQPDRLTDRGVRRVARGVRAPRGDGRGDPGRGLARRRAGSRRRRAPPRHAGGVLVHVRHRLQRPRATGVLPQRRPHVRMGWPQRRPGGAPRRRRRCRHVPRVGTHGFVRGVHPPDQGRRGAERRRRDRHRGVGVGARTPARRHVRDLGRRGGAVRHLAAARSRPRVRARARLLLRLGRRRAGDVRHRARRHPGHVGTRSQRRARRRDARDRGARGRALERLLPRPAGAHARRPDPNQFGVPDVSGRGVQDIIYSHGFVSLADDEALVLELDPSAAALWGVSSYTARLVRAARLRDPRDQPQPPAGDRRRRRPRAGRARRDRHRHRQLARHRGPARPAHDRALVPASGAAADPQRDRAAGRRSTSTCPPTIRRVDPDARADELRGRAAHVSWRYRT